MPTDNNTTDTNAPSFFKKWGVSCLLANSIGCTDPDGGNGTLEIGDGQFWAINSIASDSNSVYVADLLNHRIQKFDANGKFLTKWGSHCEIVSSEGKVLETSDDCIDPEGAAVIGDGQFNKPAGIAVDNNTIFVTDFNNRTQVFDSNGIYIAKTGSTGSANSQFRDPNGIVVDNLGYIYVADTGNHRIQKFDKDGKFVTKWGSFCQMINKYENKTFDQECVDPDELGPLERGDGQFNSPMQVALDDKNNLYVADTGNHRIQKFDKDGKFLTKWGSECEVGKQKCVMTWDNSTGELTSPGQFFYPIGLETQESEIIYVTDSGNHRIQVFDVNGTSQITKWGSHCDFKNGVAGTGCSDTDGVSGPLKVGDSQFNRPADVSQSGNHIFVADSANDRIQVFSAPNVITKSPIADAGPDIPAQPGMIVYLDGQSGSRDPDGDIVSYQWKQIPSLNSSLVALTGNTQPVAAFVAPPVTGSSIYAFELTVTDDDDAVSKDTAYVTISSGQLPLTQTANSGIAGLPPPVGQSTPSSSMGGSSGGEGGAGGGEGGGDGTGRDGGSNLAPIAVASAEPDSASPGVPVYLDGTRSSDEDGSIEDYKWEVRGGADGVTIDNDEAELTHFLMPGGKSSGSIDFRLEVTDDQGAQSSDIVSVDIEPATLSGPTSPLSGESSDGGTSPPLADESGDEGTASPSGG
jgi:NHL repeat